MSLVPSRAPSRVIPGLWQGGFLSGESGRDLARTFGLVVFCAAEHQPKEGDFPGVRILCVPLIDDPKRPLSKADAGRDAIVIVAVGPWEKRLFVLTENDLIADDRPEGVIAEDYYAPTC